ncbi:sugar ABC transporter substrate-binding protein [Rathayibacter sp. AY1G1]|uniref:ABC transporter substrate-binding protein n=1 Tax=unclassified Rathayibacter TaxID=2609250 RepID=UPI000CE8A835|nr:MULTISPECIES: extracellular solute-binding protein [unclassified Rathayibacter]PPF10604.1 sugar ABC transporter substrate-binding protein [Rathayibacter sp. AY1A5]PPF71912.1 sugar ABC transporter substrate-binding protein [Rathayibacter sp. AY1E6]PPH07255.1 sugar ABC transporter substrate-binding protein [Rathayibacter sp. AY1C1]PPH14776.1 sugar ABC transporter substrate-binding protein [Rathayibacter sp. AY1F8]PPH15196.1 sugar ABC transporter substrate-binding protein [Rathayibacter sp. AY
MKFRKIAVATAALLGTVAALTGCSGQDSGSSDGTVAMTLWQNSTTGPGQEFWDKTIADFEAANPGVTIESQAIQNEDLDGKLQTALNSGDAPDVFLQRGGGKLAAMVAGGQLKDLTDGISDQARSEIPEGSFSANTLDDKVWAMPVAVLPGGLFYSQDLFTAAGVTETPKTIDELDSAITKIKGSGAQAVALGAKDAWPAAHWYYFFALRECSADTMAEAADTKDFSDDCWVRAGEDLQDFSATEPFNEGFLTTAAQQGAGSSAGLLANHQASMELMGAWNPGVIASLTPDEKPLPDLGWFPFPEIDGGDGEAGAIMGGVDGYSCSAGAPDECVDFLNYLATSDVQKEYYAAFNAPPVNTVAQEAVTEPYLQQILEAYNSAPYVSQWLDTVYGLNVGNALNVGVVDLLAGKSDPEQLVEAVNAAAAKA